PGKHGYLVFEHPGVTDNMEMVDGTRIGTLLKDTEVPVLVLNAGDSARVEGGKDEEESDPTTAGARAPIAQLRGFGSLAQEVFDMGVPGIVAMRNLVYVPTVAYFVVDLYTACCRGQSLGEAVTSGRALLYEQPERVFGDHTSRMQDWAVPVIH